MRAVDTNVLVRLFMRDDERQIAIAEQFISKGAWISHPVLVEFVWVLREIYDHTDADLVVVLTMLLDHKQLVLQDSEVVAAALEQYRQRPALGFADCLILETARKAGNLPLGTFDKALAKLEDTQRL